MPYWLHILAVVCLSAGFACALIIIIDLLAGHKQHMWIMNVVWPISALYAGPLALWGYYKMGRLSTHEAVHHAKEQGKPMPGKQKPFWQMAALGATHCGSGCALGDLTAEWIIFAAPFTLFGKVIFGAWLLDYIFAYAFGIIFQYFTIAPMRGLSFKSGIIEAIKADSLSLTSWQVGMYGWMAIATFLLFGRELEKTDPVFWFMMQIAMLAGFATSYPVNRWLLHKKIKEPM
jgi:hypothetical protein